MHYMMKAKSCDSYIELFICDFLFGVLSSSEFPRNNCVLYYKIIKEADAGCTLLRYSAEIRYLLEPGLVHLLISE